MLIIEAKMYRATFDNQWVEDVSWGVMDGVVTMDTSRDQTWSLDATITMDLWRHLTIYEDWLAPYLKVTYPNGLVREGQLGLYLVLDSPEQRSETSGKVQLEAADPLWLLARQGFIGNLKAQAGFNKVRLVRAIIDSAVLTDAPGAGRRRFAIPDRDGENFKRAREWDKDDNRLVVCNDILEGAGMYPLWTTKSGIMTTKRAGEARLKQRHPVRTYSSHVPDSVFIPKWDLPLGGVSSEVVGTVNTTPKGLDLYNEILIVNDSPDIGKKVRVRGRITNRNNPRALHHHRGRKRTKKIRNPVLESDATAAEVAIALADELSTLNSTVRMQVLPDPQPEFSRETVNLHIYDAMGEVVAEGLHAVHRMSVGFTPSSATMTLDVGRIDEAYDFGESE